MLPEVENDPLEFFPAGEIKKAYLAALKTIKAQREEMRLDREENSKLYQRATKAESQVTEMTSQLSKNNQVIEEYKERNLSLERSISIRAGLANKKAK